MPNQSTPLDQLTRLPSQLWDVAPDAFRRGPTALFSWGVRTFRFVAFWAAVVLPCYAVWLLFGGLVAAELPAFVATLLFDCCALLVGHNYRSPSVPAGRLTS